jgi:hypothetical protein
VNLWKETLRVTKFIRKLRGGSQAILAQSDDGQIYVVKFSNNLQGTNLLFNESAGSELYRVCGLPVPSWKPLLVTDAFLEQNQNCWMQTQEGLLRQDSGLCFGSRFLGGNGTRIHEILPGASFKRVRNHESFWRAWMIDICARHADNRQAIFLEDEEGMLDAFFVDHGHLFGGPKGEQRPHFLASRYLDNRIYQDVSSRYCLNSLRVATSIDVDQLWQRVKDIPEEWKTESALGGFEQCLGRLSNADLLRNIVDTLVDAIQRDYLALKDYLALRKEKSHIESVHPILYPGISAARSDRLFDRSNEGCAPCS